MDSFFINVDDGPPRIDLTVPDQAHSDKAALVVFVAAMILYVLGMGASSQVPSSIIESMPVLMISFLAFFATEDGAVHGYTAIFSRAALRIKSALGFVPMSAPIPLIEPIEVSRIHDSVLSLRKRDKPVGLVKRLSDRVSLHALFHLASFKGQVRFSRYSTILLLFAALAGSVSAQTPPGAYTSPAAGSSSGGGGITTLTNTIDMMNPTFGMKADLRTCIGTQGVLTINSPTFTCTGANFCNNTTLTCPAGQTSDAGKRFNATQGCCNLSPTGAATTTQVVPNNTTILSVQSPTSITLSANATVTQNAVSTLYAWWATDDDAAVTLADTAYQNAPVCSTLLFPPTPFLVKNPHFNTPNPQCVNLDGGGIGGLRAPAGSFVGWSQDSSVMHLDSTFPNSTPCTFGQNNNGCFFSMQGANVRFLGINGGWNLVPNSGGHSYALVNPGIGADFSDVSFVGFSGGDGTSTGLVANAFSFFRGVQVAQFGKVCLFSNGNTYFSQGVYGNCYGNSAQLSTGPGSPIATHQVTFGTAQNVVNEVVVSGGGQWYSKQDYFYGLGNTCISNQGGAGTATIAYIDGAIIGGNGTCTTGISTSGSNASVYLSASTVISATLAINVASSGNVFGDMGQNTFTSTGTFSVNAGAKYFTNPTSTYANMTGLVPTCTFTSGGGTTPSCSLQAGSTNEKGVIIASTGTGSPGSSGTVTLTFVGTFTGPTGAAPSCIFSLDNSGTAWGAEAAAFTNTQSTTAPVMAWTNINSIALAALTASSPYRIDYTCTPR